MEMRVDQRGEAATSRLGITGAGLTLGGIALSGPLALAVVEMTRPQPPWQGVEPFVNSFHWVQLLPYAGGLVLVTGLVLLTAAVHAAARVDQRGLASAALVFVSAFAALIFFNYIVQTTFVPSLVSARDPQSAPLIAGLTMANPRSLAWAIEMWGYGLLGVGTWLLAPVFGGSGIERATSALFIANGVVSIATALMTTAWPGWVQTPLGLAAFGVWNVLLALMAVFALVTFRRRAAGMRSNAVLGGPLVA